MNPVLPSARWSPTMYSRRPYIGQAQAPPPATLTVLVLKDGAPLSGVPVEIMFQNGDAPKGVTDDKGKFAVVVTPAQKGQAVVRITPPEGVEDIGEGSAQGVDLTGAAAQVQFDLVGVSAGSPLAGIGVVGGLYALALWAL